MNWATSGWCVLLKAWRDGRCLTYLPMTASYNAQPHSHSRALYFSTCLVVQTVYFFHGYTVGTSILSLSGGGLTLWTCLLLLVE